MSCTDTCLAQTLRQQGHTTYTAHSPQPTQTQASAHQHNTPGTRPLATELPECCRKELKVPTGVTQRHSRQVHPLDVGSPLAATQASTSVEGSQQNSNNAQLGARGVSLTHLRRNPRSMREGRAARPNVIQPAVSTATGCQTRTCQQQRIHPTPRSLGGMTRKHGENSAVSDTSGPGPHTVWDDAGPTPALVQGLTASHLHLLWCSAGPRSTMPPAQTTQVGRGAAAPVIRLGNAAGRQQTVLGWEQAVRQTLSCRASLHGRALGRPCSI